MRVHHGYNLPRHWDAENLVAQTDLRITDHGKLRAKLLIFKHKTALQRFWKVELERSIGRGCVGCVTPFAHEIIPHEGKPYIVADARYFCVIGLCVPWLTMEVITHESVHAGFAYAKRKARTPWDDEIDRFEEEAVAYPVGRIARGINNFIQRKGLYP